MNLIELIRDFGRWVLLVIASMIAIVITGFCLKFLYNIFMIGWKLI